MKTQDFHLHNWHKRYLPMWKYCQKTSNFLSWDPVLQGLILSSIIQNWKIQLWSQGLSILQLSTEVKEKCKPQL